MFIGLYFMRTMVCFYRCLWVRVCLLCCVRDGGRSRLFRLPAERPLGMVNEAVPGAAPCSLGAGGAAVLSAGVFFLQVG